MTQQRPNDPPSAAGTNLLAPPRGMRDIVPPSSTGLKRLRSKLMRVFSLHGYDRVTTPPFELADVIGLGLDAIDQSTLMRFVEPDTGDVAVLRPDVTPQVARIVATRLMDRPFPARLCYEATVVRRMRHRARRRQQTFQAGVEYIGVPGVAADVEVLRVADRACETVGLTAHQLELAHVDIAKTVLASVPAEARTALADAMNQKDAATVEARLADAGVSKRDRVKLASLTELYGDPSVLKKAKRKFKSGPIGAALDELSEAVTQLRAAHVRGEIVIDLGEVRGHGYYTGLSATLLAPGPGQPIATGGRYDDLLARYGAPAPATGFAFDVDNLAWALREAGHDLLEGAPVRALLLGDGDAASELADALRYAGMPVAQLPAKTTAKKARAFAESWGYGVVIKPGARSLKLTRVCPAETGDGETKNLPTPERTAQGAVSIESASALADELRAFRLAHRAAVAAGNEG